MRLLPALFALLLGASSADAAILARCGEDLGCTLTNFTIYTLNHYDPTYARASLVSDTSVSTSYPATNRVELPFTAASSFWATGRYMTTGWSGTAGNIFMEFADAGGVVRLVLRSDTGASGGQATKLSKRNAAGTLTDLVTGMTLCSTLDYDCRIDVHIVYGTSIDIYANGVSIGTYSGDPRTDSATQLARVDYAGGMGFPQVVHWSELFVADEDTRLLRLLTCAPANSGTEQTWTGALVANINETDTDDTSNSTSFTEQRSNWSNCTLPAGSESVRDVATCNRTRRHNAGGGPQNYRDTVYIGTTDYDSVSDTTPGTSFGSACYGWGGTSPATGSNWGRTEINSMQSGIISKP